MQRIFKCLPFLLLGLLLTACPGTNNSKPLISSFSAAPNPAVSGQPVVLSWVITGGSPTQMEIDNGVGAVAGTQVTVYPSTTTTYTLTAGNSNGSSTATTTVTVRSGTPTGAAPTGSFGVGETQTDVQSDSGSSITSATDPRVVHVEPNSTFYAVAEYSDPDGITELAPFIANSAPAGMKADLQEGQSVNGFTLTTQSCDLTTKPTSVVCVYQIAVGDIQNISALPGAGKEFAYVFKIKATDTTGSYSDNSSRGYVVVGSSAPPPPPPADSYALSVSKDGTGSGTVTGPGIACGSDCSETYATDTQVTLSAAAATGSTFVGWSGACTGTGSCQVTMDAAKSVKATFDSETPTNDPLTVSIAGADPRPAVVNASTALQATVDNATAAPTYAWTQESGPSGGASFADAASKNTTVTFATEGTYALKLTATSGTETASDTVTVNVVAASANQAPTVDIAGSVSQTATLGVAKELMATGSDPDGDALTYQWTVNYGDASKVTFNPVNKAKTEAIFAAAGTYSVRVVVTDPGGLTDEDDVDIIVP